MRRHADRRRDRCRARRVPADFVAFLLLEIRPVSTAMFERCQSWPLTYAKQVIAQITLLLCG